jgi:hypothetical protein
MGPQSNEHLSYSSEVGFICFWNPYVVVIWTSCLWCAVQQCEEQMKRSSSGDLQFWLGEVVSRPTSEDAGRVVLLIRREDGRGYARYFARDVHRTQGFVKNFCDRARVTRFKAKNPPHCGKCEKVMEPCEDSNGGNYWACLNRAHEDQKPFFKDWHSVLPRHLKEIAERWDREFKRYLRREEKKGHKPERAFHIRARAKAKLNAA